MTRQGFWRGFFLAWGWLCVGLAAILATPALLGGRKRFTRVVGFLFGMIAGPAALVWLELRGEA